MKIYLDNLSIQKFKNHEIQDVAFSNTDDVFFTLANLMGFLDLKYIFDAIAKFDNQNELFQFIVSKAAEDQDPNFLMDLYDQLFAQVLTDVKNLKEVNASFLLQSLSEHENHCIPIYSKAITYFKQILSDVPKQAIHDLTLYLAFDRMTIAVAELFEQQQCKIGSLRIFRNCIIESFQHITKNSKVTLGFFRLMEALYAFDMRNENLDTYSEGDFETLCKSSKVLSDRDRICFIPYVDIALMHMSEEKEITCLTTDSEEKVELTLVFADFMINKLYQEGIGWEYRRAKSNIIV
jgi:hypothetical protein